MVAVLPRPIRSGPPVLAGGSPGGPAVTASALVRAARWGEAPHAFVRLTEDLVVLPAHGGSFSG
ncbi:hypothetical protein AMK24_22640 [Streptomyces sp. CB02366]|nr:hypothetical protein AMK24_22640 [Streptomyces sp. CB02366]